LTGTHRVAALERQPQYTRHSGDTGHPQGIMSTTGPDLPTLLPALLPRLWAFALRISGDRHDAEDLVQRACVRALERAHQLQPGTSALSWMFAIVHSTWINELRARSRRNRASTEWDDDMLETVADPAMRTPEENAINNQIVSAVGRLPEAQRAGDAAGCRRRPQLCRSG
jgi:RNA polymerase sigma-70 factor, ECF subfamily